jgi:hypothetical protein
MLFSCSQVFLVFLYCNNDPIRTSFDRKTVFESAGWWMLSAFFCDLHLPSFYEDCILSVLTAVLQRSVNVMGHNDTFELV